MAGPQGSPRGLDPTATCTPIRPPPRSPTASLICHPRTHCPPSLCPPIPPPIHPSVHHPPSLYGRLSVPPRSADQSTGFSVYPATRGSTYTHCPFSSAPQHPSPPTHAFISPFAVLYGAGPTHPSPTHAQTHTHPHHAPTSSSVPQCAQRPSKQHSPSAGRMDRDRHLHAGPSGVRLPAQPPSGELLFCVRSFCPFTGASVLTPAHVPKCFSIYPSLP